MECNSLELKCYVRRPLSTCTGVKGVRRGEWPGGTKMPNFVFLSVGPNRF